jgi:hypothetical protein
MIKDKKDKMNVHKDNLGLKIKKINEKIIDTENR